MKPVQLRCLHTLQQQFGDSFVYPDIGHPRLQQSGEVLLTFGGQFFRSSTGTRKTEFL